MDADEKTKIAHETLLREIHNIDDITEKHAQIVIAISAALVAFTSTHWPSPKVVYLIAVFGIFICLEWIFKITRHRNIFRSCHDKLTELEKNIGIDALRPLKKPHRKLFSRDGFTILLWFAIVLILFWVLVSLGVRQGLLK